MLRNFSLAIVGAGPAGLFCAKRLLKSSEPCNLIEICFMSLR